VKVTRNGQTTIPAELRAKFGIQEGTILTVEETKDGILLRLPKWIEDLAGSGDFDVEKAKKAIDIQREEWR
jgi:AbrB family looped-hinge helix DNA binding protein